MKNYQKVSEEKGARIELHDRLNLTGAEISINVLPAGASVPFVHSHKENEEIYFILEGCGHAMVDGERIPLEKGDWLRISPKARRQFFAEEKEGMKYVCIQVRVNSLEQYTATDAVIG